MYSLAWKSETKSWISHVKKIVDRFGERFLKADESSFILDAPFYFYNFFLRLVRIFEDYELKIQSSEKMTKFSKSRTGRKKNQIN